LGTCPNIVKSSRFSLIGAKTNHPAHSSPASIDQTGSTVQDGQSAIPEEAVNFTSDIDICQVGSRKFLCIFTASRSNWLLRAVSANLFAEIVTKGTSWGDRTVLLQNAGNSMRLSRRIFEDVLQ